jgi:hypothetical protein
MAHLGTLLKHGNDDRPTDQPTNRCYDAMALMRVVHCTAWVFTLITATRHDYHEIGFGSPVDTTAAVKVWQPVSVVHSNKTS